MAFNRTCGSVFATPQRLRADHPHPVGAGVRDEPALCGRAVGPGVGEPAAEHDQCLDPLGQAGGRDAAHAGRWDGDHGEVHVAGDVGDRGIRVDTTDGAGLGVDRVDRAGEVAPQQVQQHRVADLGGVGGGADHRDRPWVQHVVHAAGLGALLAGASDLHGALGGVDVELQMQYPVGDLAADLEARVAEHPHHLGVLGQDLGLEPAHPTLTAGRGEVLEQDRAQPAVLVIVADDEGGLRRADHGCAVRAERALVAAHRDDLVAEQDHQRHPGVVVDDGEPLQVSRGDLRVRPEVAQVAGALGEPGVELHDCIRVARQDRTQVHHTAVRRHHVGLPVLRVLRRVRCGRSRRPWRASRPSRSPPYHGVSWVGRWARPDQSRGS